MSTLTFDGSQFMNKTFALRGIALAFVGLATLASPAVAEEITLFQPGQSAWEWLLVPSKHDGGKRIREGKTCLFCHAGEEPAIGNSMVSANELEPSPISGMAGTVAMTVSASYDDTNLYLSACWQQPEAAAPWGDEEAEQHLTFMLGSSELSLAPIAGCWASCHNDLPDMPNAAGQELTKYLPGSRNKLTATGGGTDIKPAAELQAQLAEGKYLEYWQLLLDGDQVTSARDGYFLDHRAKNPDSAVSGSGQAGAGACSLQLVRPLAAAGAGRHALQEGVEYTLAVALHANHASGRHHYTSFPMRFRLGAGGDAELTAQRK